MSNIYRPKVRFGSFQTLCRFILPLNLKEKSAKCINTCIYATYLIVQKIRFNENVVVEL